MKRNDAHPLGLQKVPKRNLDLIIVEGDSLFAIQWAQGIAVTSCHPMDVTGEICDLTKDQTISSSRILRSVNGVVYSSINRSVKTANSFHDLDLVFCFGILFFLLWFFWGAPVGRASDCVCSISLYAVVGSI